MSPLHRFGNLVSRLIAQEYAWPAQDVILPGGQHLHLVGSIHMGTSNMVPLSSHLLHKLHQADALIVEADIRDGEPPFPTRTDVRPLWERLDESTWQQTEKKCSELGISLFDIETLPVWQVALLLQVHQARLLGLRPEFGIDYQLLQAAQLTQRPIIELEGTQNQLSLLHNLPDEGLMLLQDTLTHWHVNAHLLQTMVSWWLESPPDARHPSLPNTFSSSLFKVLMSNRNRQWQHFLHQLPAGRYVVAVGALHLYGDDNLPSLLRNAKNAQ